MAPPVNFTIKQLDAIKAKASFKTEEKRKKFVFEAIPELLKDELIQYIVNAREDSMELEDIYAFLSERVSIMDQQTSIVVKIDRLMNVRFSDGSNVNLALFKDLTTTIETLGLPKELAKSIVMMLYVHKVPRMVKERLDDIYTLPQYDDLYEIVKKADIRYSQKEHFGERRTDRRDSWNDSERNRRDSGLRKQDFKEKCEYGDGCYYDKNDKNDKRPKVGLKKQNEERKNDNDKIVKTYFVDTDDNVPIYTDITFEGVKDGPLTVMVDTGSDNYVMTIEDFVKLPPTIKRNWSSARG